jgi:Protein of unknown function (DUF 659)
MDRITIDQAAAASDAMTKYFVSCGIPFAVADYPSFSSFLKTIRPAYANQELRPSRLSMASVRLPELYAMTKVLVREALSEWAEFAKAALLVDGGESTTNEHIVNFLAVAGDKGYFLESFQTGSDRKGAADQAALVQRVIDLYPGIFHAVVSDSTTCCRQMREVIAAANPGMASINDQAHAANLLASDLRNTFVLKNTINDASVVAKYVRNHYRLTFSCHKVGPPL